MLLLLQALKFLTAAPWPRSREAAPQEVAQSAAFFPLVGFFLGIVLVLVDRLLDSYLASEILSVVLVTVLIFATRAKPLADLASTWDQLAPRDNGSLSGSRIGQGLGLFGLLAVLVVIALKFRAIEVMGEARAPGLLLAPAIGRWAMVVLGYGSTSTGEDEREIDVEAIKGKQLIVATALLLCGVFLIARRVGLWVALWVSLLALGSRYFLHRHAGGVTEKNLGAVAEMSEALAFVLFATLLADR
jgi:adenosylcobinamide-GDP ribazoletransferase